MHNVIDGDHRCDKTYDNHWFISKNFKGKEESVLLRQGLSHAISRLSIIFSLKSLQ